MKERIVRVGGEANFGEYLVGALRGEFRSAKGAPLGVLF